MQTPSKMKAIVYTVFVLLFFLPACADDSPSDYLLPDGDSSDGDWVNVHGSDGDGNPDIHSNPDLPHISDTPEILDPTAEDITIYESRFELAMDNEQCYLKMPIGMENKSKQTIRIETTFLDLNGDELANRSSAMSYEIQRGEQKVMVELGACPTLPEEIESYLLAYEASWGDVVLSGKVSYFMLAPKIQAKAMGSDNLLEGEQTVYRILAQDPDTQQPMADVSVAVELKEGNSILQSMTVQTDSFGIATVPLDVPSELDGQYTLNIVVDSDSHGQQTLSAPVIVVRESRILVTTDKPFYQPGQTMHVRTLALKVPHQLPLSNQDITIEIVDSKGNKLFRDTQQTSEYGVAATSFRLAELVDLGKYTIRAYIQGNSGTILSEKTVTVDNYTLPRFKIAFNADKSFYQPGERLTGTISSEYFYGKPVSSGKVHIVARKYDVEMVDFTTIDGTMDENGSYSFQLDLPAYFVGSELDQGKARVFLEISVTDAAMHSQVLNRSVQVVAEPVMVNLVPEAGRIIQGESQRFFLLLSDPAGRPLSATCTISADSNEFEVEVGALGMAVFEYTPENVNTSIQVKATVAGYALNRSFSFEAEMANSYVMMRLLKAIYDVGETIRPEIIVANRPDLTQPELLPDRIYLDVIVNGQTMLMSTVELQDGHGMGNLDLSPDLAGPMELYAYYLTPEGQIIRDSRVIYVRQASDLSVSMATSQSQYRPREEAQITMQVEDLNGDPVQAGLGVTIVDEAVFALQEYQPGMERTYFQLEQEIMNPTYEIHGFSPSDLYGGEPEDPEEQDDLDQRAQAYFAANGTAQTYAVNMDSFERVRINFNNVCSSTVSRLVRKLIAQQVGESCTPSNLDVDALVESLSDCSACDPWGNPIKWDFYNRGWAVQVKALSAGPDEVFGTEYDIQVTHEFCEDYYNTADGDSWVTDGDACADGDYDSGNGTTASTHLRSWFPETLLVEPNLITASDGTVDLSVTMPDSITTWRLTALANTTDGQLGSMTDGILVFQDFFVDIDFPTFLTQNDEVYLPLAIYNYLPQSQTIQLMAEAEDWFEPLDGLSKSVEVGANQVVGIYFPIRVLKIGQQSMTLWAEGTEMQDAVQRQVTVRPDGVERTASQSDWLEESLSLQLTIPDRAIEDSESLFVKIFPGLLSQAVEGLDSMLRMPGGCFEQTSSSTYPNILVLQYLVETDQLTPEIELKARDYISQGYQRLLTFEVDGGGFEWFGNTPAHTVLTCYGLMEFIDMAKVHAIDANLIPRTAAWLAQKQSSDGSIPPSSGGISEGAINNYQGSVLRTTAYVTWALSRSGLQASAVSSAANFLLSHIDEAEDTYTQAMVAMALVSAGYEQNGSLRSLITSIVNAKQQDESDGYFWTQDAATETYSTGPNAVLETTALIGLMLLEDGLNQDVVNGIINWLVRQKDSFGNWSTTQGTVLALRLMIASMGSRLESADAVITVSANGGTETELVVTSDTIDLMRLVDLGEQVVPGDNQIDIDFGGSGRLMYQATASWYEPGEEIPDEQGPLTIDVAYDRTSLEVNDLLGVTVTIDNVSESNVAMVLASVGLPPGFDLVSTALDERISQGGVLTRYETTPHQILFYINEIASGGQVTIGYELLARWPMDASSGEACVYPYYNPENKSEQQSQVITVNEVM